MLKKTIKFKNFNDEDDELVAYFHLSKSELLELEASHPAGFQTHLQHVLDSNDRGQLVAVFKDLILKSYGKRTEDGSGFRKSAQLREEFESTPAFDALFFELATEAEKAVEFINGIVPANLEKELAKLAPANGRSETLLGRASPPEQEPETRNVFDDNDRPKVLSHADLLEMDAVDLQDGLRTGRYVMHQP